MQENGEKKALENPGAEELMKEMGAAAYLRRLKRGLRGLLAVFLPLAAIVLVVGEEVFERDSL